MKISRYPGVKPFETKDKDLFFGRKRDIADLNDLISLERLVVLFGKSGYGKSSLVNAGIIPTITGDNEEQALQPLLVRLGSYMEGCTASPLDNLLVRLQEKKSVVRDSAFLNKLFAEPTLWYHFKRRQTNHPQRYLLIFDQFEEFFSYPLPQQEAFKSQLAELLYTDTPQIVREAASKLSKEQRQFLAQPLEVKSLFVIRSDRMSRLDSMKDKLPAILHKIYEIKGLSQSQAREAIVKPATAEGKHFSSKRFTYSDDALKKILSELSKTSHSARSDIEAFQLQILCQYIESIVTERNLDAVEISESDLPDIANIYEAYYKHQIARLESTMQLTAQRLIEEGLLFEDPVTGDTRRLSMDAGVLAQQFDAPQQLLDDLENTFLLRREANLLGGFNYEISHDTMIAPIRKAKTERRIKEERLENDRKRQESEDKAKKEILKRELAERQRKVAKRIAWIAWAGCIAALIAMTFAFDERRKAKHRLKLLTESENKRKATEAQKLIEQAKTDLEIQQYWLAKQKLDSAWVRDPSNPNINTLLKKIPPH